MTSHQKNIVDTAIAAGTFSMLAKALTAAGLVEALKGDGPFTVFAPNDAAFAKMPSGTLETLLMPESKDKLVAILKLHVVPRKIMASNLAGKSASPKSLNGEDLAVDGSNGVTVNGVKVISADIECSNGVIHVVDTVIMPRAERKAA